MDGGALSIPDYLERHYWWAYVRPWAVRVFEREWLVNLILWGWYRPLRDAVLAQMGDVLPGRTLKISCCYGGLEPMLARSVRAGGGALDLIDIAPAQLDNAARKLTPFIADGAVRLSRQDARALSFRSETFDRAVLFFLTHEQPDAAKRETFGEALRVLKPGGVLVIAEFGRPVGWHPLRFIWHPVLRVLEPFAAPLWTGGLVPFLPDGGRGLSLREKRMFGGYYRLVEVTKPFQETPR